MSSRRLGVAAALIEGRLLAGDVSVSEGRICDVGLSPRGSGLAGPGLVDLQVNGYGGVDLLADADDDAWRAAGRALLRDGVTAYLPTLTTAPPAVTLAGLKRSARMMWAPGGARILGVHLEGPFLSDRRLGTHPPAHRRDPDPSLLTQLVAAGPVAMVTLAPELPGATAMTELLSAAGVLVSLGHSAADAAVTRRARAAGARAVTHLFNAMEPMSARVPGLAGVALVEPGFTATCIADGVHVCDELLTLAVRCARGRLALVSDAIAAAGTTLERVRLGDVALTVRDGVATRADGTISGGVSSLAGGVRHLAELGVELAEAIGMATQIPAALLRRSDVGVLRPGGPADVAVWNEEQARITRVLRDGVEVSGGGP